MNTFRSRPPSRSRVLNLRITDEQDELLARLARHLELPSKSDVLRTALDYWLANAPDARRGSKRK